VTVEARANAGRLLLNILDIEPGLAAALAPDEQRAARRAATAPAAILQRGAWEVDDRLAAGSGDIGLLIAGGFMSRVVHVGPRGFAELLGSGDIVRPWDTPDELASVRPVTTWTVLERATVALVDEQLIGRLCAWPSVLAGIARRMSDRARSLAVHLAVHHMSGIEQRILITLWHFADRWGRVTPAGVQLTIPLTHELLARIVGARRPTVTSALRNLRAGGLVTRGPAGSWLLHGEPPGQLYDLRAQVAG
jgi:CRP-like cAMP-binding protein